MTERKRFLEDYETVQARIAKFYQKYPEGRIVTELVSDPNNWERCRYKASLYRNFEDEVPLATGHAVEAADDARSAVNRAFHEENAESSAIGRALANAGFAPKGGTSREPAAPAASRAKPAEPAGEHPVLQMVWDKAQGMGVTPAQMKAFLVQEFGVSTSKALDETQIAKLAAVFEQVDTPEAFQALLRPAASRSSAV